MNAVHIAISETVASWTFLDFVDMVRAVLWGAFVVFCATAGVALIFGVSAP